MIRAMKDKKSKEMILNSRASSLIYDKFKKFSSVFSNIDNSNLTINEILNEIKESDQKEFKDELESADNMKLLGGIPLILINDPEKYYEEGVLKYQYIITLKAGQYFGEVGLLLKKPRAATILCKENTDFAVLESDDFKKILKTVEKNQMEDRVDFFKENLFNEMSRDNVLRLSYMFQKIKSFKGQYLYKEGEVCKFIYLIKKGEIEV